MAVRSATDKIGTVAGLVGQLLLIGFFAFLGQSFLWLEGVPTILRIGIVAVAVVAFFRPPDGLLIVAALTPITRLLTVTVWPSPQFARVTEVIALAFLTGALLAGLRRVRLPTIRGVSQSSALLLGLVVVASLVVQLVALQVWKDYPWPFYQQSLAFLAQDYLIANPDPRPWSVWPAGMGFVSSGVLMLEGIALFLLAGVYVRREAGFGYRLARALVAGGFAAALLSVSAVTEAIISSPNGLGNLDEILSQRVSVTLAKVNTVGSYFLLPGFIAAGLALGRSRRLWWAGAALLVALAIWLTGSRSAIIAGFVGITFLAAFVASSGFRQPVYRRFIVIGVGFLLATVLFSALRPSTWITDELRLTLSFRLLFAERSVEMLATRPLLGVGIGQYYAKSPSFGSEMILNNYPRENAHNNYFQVACELGLIGFVLFAGAVVPPMYRSTRKFLADPSQHLLGGLAIGLLAFLTTCLMGHPLLFAEVSYAFWIALGLVVGICETTPAAGSTPTGGDEHGAHAHLAGWAVPLAVVIVLGTTIPTRIQNETDDANLALVSYGFHDWEVEPNGLGSASGPPWPPRYRWTGRRATFFLYAGSQSVVIPIRPGLLGPISQFEVDITLDGQAVRRVILTEDRWHNIRLSIPANGDGRFNRIDLNVHPAWHPADYLKGNTDARELGIKVGDFRTIED